MLTIRRVRELYYPAIPLPESYAPVCTFDNRSIMRNEFSAVTVERRLPRKIIKLAERLMALAS